MRSPFGRPIIAISGREGVRCDICLAEGVERWFSTMRSLRKHVQKEHLKGEQRGRKTR